MKNISIIGEICMNLWCLKHSVYYNFERYAKSLAYDNINKCMSEYVSLNPYT